MHRNGYKCILLIGTEELVVLPEVLAALRKPLLALHPVKLIESPDLDYCREMREAVRHITGAVGTTDLHVIFFSPFPISLVERETFGPWGSKPLLPNTRSVGSPTLGS